MDKDAIMVLRPVAVGVTAAVLACAALVMGAQAAKADTVSQGGVVISRLVDARLGPSGSARRASS